MMWFMSVHESISIADFYFEFLSAKNRVVDFYFEFFPPNRGVDFNFEFLDFDFDFDIFI